MTRNGMAYAWDAGTMVALTLILAIAHGAAVSAQPSDPATASPVSVTIEGGADTSGLKFTWSVSHTYTSPLVALEFPQFRAGWVTAPEGWTGHLTNPRGQANKDGTAIFEVQGRHAGLVADRVAVFELGVVAEGAARESRQVLARFADGSKALATAEVPIKEKFGDRSTPLIGLGVIFALYLAMKWLKKRRRPAVTQS